MSVKKPWDSSWKTNCRQKIKGCDGVIAIITSNTKNADGEIWEIKCAKDESVPCIGVWGNNSHFGVRIPSELSQNEMYDWTWYNIASWIKSL